MGSGQGAGILGKLGMSRLFGLVLGLADHDRQYNNALHYVPPSVLPKREL